MDTHQHDPDFECAMCAAGGDGSVVEAQLMTMIKEHGFAVLGIAGEDGSSSFSYTVGLTFYMWPELIMLGQIEWSYKMLNVLVEHFRSTGCTPEEGDVVGAPGLDPDHPIRLRACEVRGDYPLSFAFGFFGFMTRALQVLVPDDDGKYPGDEGADKTWQVLLPSGLGTSSNWY